MFKSLIAAAVLAVSVTSHAYTTVAEAVFATQLPHIQGVIVTQGLNWKVGQENNYKLSMGGFLNGTMKNVCSRNRS